MKKIFLAIILITSVNVIAQTEIIPIEQEATLNAYASRNKYFKDVNGVLEKFLGTWQYSGDININGVPVSLQVTFHKQENRHVSSHWEDWIYATFIYSENGIIVYDTTNDTNQYIYGGFFRDPLNTNKLHLIYSEPSLDAKGMRYNFNIEYIPGSNPQLGWDNEVTFALGETVVQPRIPKVMVLQKI